MIAPFHLAIPVGNLSQAEDFYGGLLGCNKGRQSDHWTDWNFFGHQLVTHVTDKTTDKSFNSVDGKHVPVPHFGVVLPMTVWQKLADRLSAENVDFVVEPHVRFKGQTGEQATMFFYDPFGNALEFKAFADITALFKV